MELESLSSFSQPKNFIEIKPLMKVVTIRMGRLPRELQSALVRGGKRSFLLSAKIQTNFCRLFNRLPVESGRLEDPLPYSFKRGIAEEWRTAD